MNDILENIVGWFPEIAEAKFWGVLITGGLFTYLIEWLSKRFDSGYYEWKIVKRLAIADAVLLVILLLLSSQWPWFLLLILPWGYFLVRYFCFKEKSESMEISQTVDSQDLVRYKYLQYLERRELCRWEVRKYLFPAMNVLFEIGAMKLLDEKLEQLKGCYGETYEWKRLKSFLCSNRHEYVQMLELLKAFEDDKHLTKQERCRTVLNIFHAYRCLNNEEGVNTYILKIEHMVFEGKAYSVEALDDLLYHYEMTHNEEGVSRILEILNNITVKDFSAYVEFVDVQYMHNKRIGNVEGNRRLLDEMSRKQAEMEQDNARVLRFGLRLLRYYFENNYSWCEYSLALFNQAELYLAHSDDIAFEYLETVMFILKNAHDACGISLPPEQLTHLFETIRRYIDKYMPEYDKRITNLPDELVYRKREMLEHKVTYARLVGNLTKDEPACLNEICRLENQIIRLCYDNGENREALHFLVVLTDEILNYYDTIQIDINNDLTDPDILRAEKEKPFFMDQVKQNMESIDNVLRQNDYNHTLAYYIFFQAYFNFKIGNLENARYALHKFEETNVSIKNFSIAIQNLYQMVRENVKL